MKALDLAMQYMEIFYSGSDIETLSPLFANDFIFEGPFFHFDSAKGYLDSLRKNPPKDMNYEIIYSFEKENCACLIYQFSKKDKSTPMAQVFDLSGDKIHKIILIFDTSTFRGIGE